MRGQKLVFFTTKLLAILLVGAAAAQAVEQGQDEAIALCKPNDFIRLVADSSPLIVLDESNPAWIEDKFADRVNCAISLGLHPCVDAGFEKMRTAQEFAMVEVNRQTPIHWQAVDALRGGLSNWFDETRKFQSRYRYSMQGGVIKAIQPKPDIKSKLKDLQEACDASKADEASMLNQYKQIVSDFIAKFKPTMR